MIISNFCPSNCHIFASSHAYSVVFPAPHLVSLLLLAPQSIGGDSGKTTGLFTQSATPQKCLSAQPNHLQVMQDFMNTVKGGRSVLSTPSLPGLKRTLLVIRLALTASSLPSSRRIPCIAWPRESARIVGRSCSAAALQRKLICSTGMSMASILGPGSGGRCLPAALCVTCSCKS